MREFIRLRLGTSRCKNNHEPKQTQPNHEDGRCHNRCHLRYHDRSSAKHAKVIKTTKEKRTVVEEKGDTRGHSPDANENKEKEKRTVVELVGACVITGVTGSLV